MTFAPYEIVTAYLACKLHYFETKVGDFVTLILTFLLNSKSDLVATGWGGGFVFHERILSVDCDVKQQVNQTKLSTYGPSQRKYNHFLSPSVVHIEVCLPGLFMSSIGVWYNS